MISHNELINFISNLSLDNVDIFKQRLIAENNTELKLICMLPKFAGQLSLLASALVGTMVTHVNLSVNNIQSMDAVKFVRNLQGSNVTYLDLGFCKINGKKLVDIAEHLKHTEITHIILCHNHIKLADAVAFVVKLKETKVFHVDFSRNKFNAKEAALLVASLEGTNITQINLSANDINDANICVVAENLRKTKINHIDLSENHIKTPEAVVFANGLKGSQVVYVNLSSNKINGSNLGELSYSFKNTYVTYIDLSDNEITNSEATQLAENLHFSNITKIILNDNQIGAKDIEDDEEEDIETESDFVKSLSGSQVSYVSLNFNNINGKNLAHFAKCLQVTNITHIDLSWQLIVSADLAEFAKNLRGTNICYIDLSHNPINGDLTKFVHNIKDTTVTKVNGISSPELTEVLKHNQRRLMLPPYLCLGVDMFREEELQEDKKVQDKKLKFAGKILKKLPLELRVQVVKHLPFMQHPQQISPEIQSYRYLTLINKQHQDRLRKRLDEKHQADKVIEPKPGSINCSVDQLDLTEDNEYSPKCKKARIN